MSCSESEAVVARVESGLAFVRLTQALSSCGRCGEAGGCGKSSLLGGDRERLVAVPNEAGVRAGDVVVLSVPSGAVWRAALRAYLMPAGLAIAGAALGDAAFSQSFSPVAGAVLGVLFGVGLLRLLPNRTPVLSMRIKSSQPPIGTHA